MLSIERFMNKRTTEMKTNQPDVITSTKQLKEDLLKKAVDEQNRRIGSGYSMEITPHWYIME